MGSFLVEWQNGRKWNKTEAGKPHGTVFEPFLLFFLMDEPIGSFSHAQGAPEVSGNQ